MDLIPTRRHSSSSNFYVTGLWLTLLLSIFLSANNKVGAQTNINKSPLQARATLKFNPIPQGANSPLKVNLELAPEFHAYADKFKLQIIIPNGLRLSKFELNPVIEFLDAFSKKMKKGVQGKVQMSAVLGIPRGFPTGKVNSVLEVTYQACTKEYCLLPKRIQVPLEFTISPETSPIVASNQNKNQNDLLAQATEKGWLFVFLMVFLGGVLTCFTPCIFPMIPITLAVIGATGTHHSRWQNFIVSGFYVLGIAITYSTLGLIAALTGSLFGSFLGHPAVAIGFAVLFLAMALSLYGLYEIQAPAFIRNRLGTHQPKSRYASALVSGLFAGAIASPCVGPVLVGVLAFVAQKQDPLIGFSLLFTFALGMGQLFLLLGAFSPLLKKVPKVGPWMNITKFIFGTVMVGLALYYVQPVVPTRAFETLLGISFILITSFHGVFAPIKGLTTTKSLIKGAMIAGFLIGSLFLFKATFPNYFGGPQTKPKHKLLGGWKVFDERLLQQAYQQKRPMIIDFYADWCAACKELKAITFMDKKVIEKGKKFTLLRFDATQMTPEFDVLKEKFKILGLPTIVFHDGHQWRPDLTLTGFESAQKFLERMKKSQSQSNTKNAH